MMINQTTLFTQQNAVPLQGRELCVYVACQNLSTPMIIMNYDTIIRKLMCVGTHVCMHVYFLISNKFYQCNETRPSPRIQKVYVCMYVYNASKFHEHGFRLAKTCNQETNLGYHPDYNFHISVKKPVRKPDEMHNQ